MLIHTKFLLSPYRPYGRRVVDGLTEKISHIVIEIPRRFTFSEVAYARHNSSKLDSALTYSQHRLCRDDIKWTSRVNIYIIAFV